MGPVSAARFLLTADPDIPSRQRRFF